MRTSSTAGGGSWRHSGTAECLHNFGRRFDSYFFSSMISGSHPIPKENLLLPPLNLSIYSAFAYFFFFS